MSIEAMKQMVESLSELVPDPQIDFGPAYEGAKKRQQKAIAAGRQAISEAKKQEPVAWMFQHEETGRMMFVEAQQLEWGFEKGNPRLKKIGPLYTTPPQRPSRSDIKPLTDEAKAVIDAARAAMDDSVEAYDLEDNIIISSELAASLSLCLDEYDRAIEAAHGIKE